MKTLDELLTEYREGGRFPTYAQLAACAIKGQAQTSAAQLILRDVCALDYSDNNFDDEKMLSVTIDDLRTIVSRYTAAHGAPHPSPDDSEAGK